MQDVGSPSFHLHGPEGIDGFFDAARTFISFYTGIDVKSRPHHDAIFENPGLKVKMIPINIDSPADSRLHDDTKKKAKLQTKLLAYYCQMPQIAGQLNVEKCREFKVPIGPLLGKLKGGEDVTLPDGRLVKSSEVCEPPKRGTTFIVIDCPDISHIEEVISNRHLCELRSTKDDDRQVDLVIHFGAEEVSNHPKYRDWIHSFPEACKHWMVKNSSPYFINHHDSHRMLYLCGKIDQEIFPRLFTTKELEEAMQEESSSSNAQTFSEIESEMGRFSEFKSEIDSVDRITIAQPLDKIAMRPLGYYERIKRNYVIDGLYRLSKFNPKFEESLQKHRELLKSMPTPREHEPELIFLGTGSAIPSKYRNTSCILVNLRIPQPTSVILDCGEDSYGQLIRYYGPDKASHILKQLKMVYISHQHPDHHIGLIRLIKERRKITSEPMILLIPPALYTLLDYHNENFEDLSASYLAFPTDRLRSAPRRHRDFPSAHRVLKFDLKKHTSSVIDDITIVGVDHCRDSCAVVLSFAISRPGMSKFTLAYSGDAQPSEDFIKAAQGCDLLIHEATFDHRGVEDARLKKHSTTHEAIEVGRKMEAKFTLLTHFSSRFAKIPYITDEFDHKVGYAFDFLTLRCPSHLPRLPAMNDLMKVLFDTALQILDDKHTKKESNAKILQHHKNVSELRE